MSDESDYFGSARSWASDTRARELRLVRTAWTIAGIATAIALFEAVALAMLTPLKTVQPVTLMVDRQTGYVQSIDPTQPKRIGHDAALVQSLLAQYVGAREGFDRTTLAQDYRRVALWSTGSARSQYLALMPASNPDSPLQRLPSGAQIVTRVKSVSPLSDSAALVRFDTVQQGRAGQGGPPQAWISIVRFLFSDAPMSFDDRLINPLGFQVVSYRRDQEAPPAAAPPVAASARAIPQGPSAMPRGIDAISARGTAGSRSIRIIPSNEIPMGSPLVRLSDAAGASDPTGQP